MDQELLKLRTDFEDHQHTGIDSPQISAQDLGPYKVVAAAPTYTGFIGEIVIVDDGSSTYGWYVYTSGGWKSVALT